MRKSMRSYEIASFVAVTCVLAYFQNAQQGIQPATPSTLLVKISDDRGFQDTLTFCQLGTKINFCRSSIGPNKCSVDCGESKTACDLGEVYLVARELNHEANGNHTLMFRYQDSQGKCSQFKIRTSIAKFQNSTSLERFKDLLKILDDGLYGPKFLRGGTYELIDSSTVSERSVGTLQNEKKK